MTDRYYLPPPINDIAELQGSEAHHLLHVMRTKIGDAVTLFDGQGGEYRATLRATGRDWAELHIFERDIPERELPGDLILAVALPKGDRQKWLLEKIVELGVTHLVPLKTERSVAQVDAGVIARLDRGVIEASKQSGRTRLLQVATPFTVAQWAEQYPSAALRLVAHPGQAPLAAAIGPRFPLPAGERVVATIGPEGGFTDEEVALLSQHAWQPVSLGARILRVETAACLLASTLSQAWSANFKAEHLSQP